MSDFDYEIITQNVKYIRISISKYLNSIVFKAEFDSCW